MRDANKFSSIDAANKTRVTLYPPGHVALAAFVGTSIAGFLLLALNYRRLGYSAAASIALIIGLIASLLLIVFKLTLLAHVSNFSITLVHTLLMYFTARVLQGRQYSRGIDDGAIEGSGWIALGIGFLSLAALFVIFFVGMFAVALFTPRQ